METRPTIKVFLAEGNPTGLRTIETMNWTGRAIVIPRDSIDLAMQRVDLDAQGVYFLLENDIGQETGSLYIGESENVKERIRSHNKNKDFWGTAVCFVSTQGSLNKAHAKYLEELLIRETKEANRVRLENGNEPSQTRLNESDRADVETFAEYIKLILATIGWTFLKKVTDFEKNPEEIYICRGPGAEARGLYTSEGMVVRAGSRARKEIVDSAKERYLKLRPILMEDGVLRDDGPESYVFVSDYVFSSPSGAAQNVLGRNANGWTEWKRESDGKTLDQVVRKEE